MDYQYLNKLIDLGVGKSYKASQYNNDEIGWYSLKWDPDTVWSVLRGRIRIPSKTGPDPQHWTGSSM